MATSEGALERWVRERREEAGEAGHGNLAAFWEGLERQLEGSRGIQEAVHQLPNGPLIRLEGELDGRRETEEERGDERAAAALEAARGLVRRELLQRDRGRPDSSYGAL